MGTSGIRLVLPNPLRGTMPPFVLLSLLAHVGGAAALILLPMLRPPRVAEDVMFVKMVGAVPQQRQAAPQPAAVPVETSPPPEPVKKPPVETRIPDKPKPLPERIEPVRSKPKPEPVSPRPAPQTRPGQTTPSTPSTASASDASGSVTSMTAEDFQFSWYRDAVTAALHGRWKKPILDGVREAREVRVAFEIQRDGSFQKLRVERTSGLPTLDRSALRAVSDAAPFPPLPPSWPERTLEAGFLFRLYPE